MKKFLETLVNIYKIEELRNRIGVTLTILLIYRFGAQITLPGIDAVQLAELSNRTGGGGLLGVLNMFTGGAFAVPDTVLRIRRRILSLLSSLLNPIFKLLMQIYLLFF